MASAFSAAHQNRLDLSVGIALGSASQIALFVAPVLVLLSYVIGPTPMDLQFWPGAVVMILIATLTATLVTNTGKSAWFVGVLVLMVYLIFAMTLYLLPPKSSNEGTAPQKTTERSIQRAYYEGRLTSFGATGPKRSACYANFS
jgi:Ca2+:H+ antiporter